MLKHGDKLKALCNETFVDHTTKGNLYEVVKVTDIGFYITNDKGKVVLPTSTRFERIQQYDHSRKGGLI